MKVLSVNLWFDKYGHKTLAQLKSFAYFGCETYAATVKETDTGLRCEIYHVGFQNTDDASMSGSQKNEGLKTHTLTTAASLDIPGEAFGAAYFGAFRWLFDYAVDNGFDIVYFRRLMSKIAYAGPHFKHLKKYCSIVYEFPTFPFDIPANRLYALRDKLELFMYGLVRKHIAVTSCCLYQHGKPGKDWLLFENGIDIDNYDIHEMPELAGEESTINMLMIANMQIWHRSERILYAMRDYRGSHKLHLTVASPSSPEYEEMKALAGKLDIADMIDFNDYLTLDKINKISKNCHIAVGQLSGSEYGVMETHAIKHKDYCGMGLPMFSTCTDTSFPNDYPYYYFLKDTDADIDLDKIIRWYEDIRKEHPGYRREMYEHAKENLQYHKYVREILDSVEQGNGSQIQSSSSTSK